MGASLPPTPPTSVDGAPVCAGLGWAELPRSVWLALPAPRKCRIRGAGGRAASSALHSILGECAWHSEGTKERVLREAGRPAHC